VGLNKVKQLEIVALTSFTVYRRAKRSAANLQKSCILSHGFACIATKILFYSFTFFKFFLAYRTYASALFTSLSLA